MESNVKPVLDVEKVKDIDTKKAQEIDALNNMAIDQQKKLEESEDKPKSIHMPSQGQRFKLWDTKFEVVKSKGMWFQAKVVT